MLRSRSSGSVAARSWTRWRKNSRLPFGPGHPRRSGLQEAVGEAARRGPDVETVESGRIDPQGGEGVRELLSSARHEARGPIDLEHGVRLDLRAWFLVPRHEAGEHERLCLGAALGEPALNEEH